MNDSVKKEQTLFMLHEILRKREQDNAVQEEVELIKEEIRKSLPPVDTSRAFPCKKTPSGQIRVLHLNYSPSRTDKQASTETEKEYLQFFARTAKELGLQLEIMTHKENREEIEEELEKKEYQSLDYKIIESPNPLSKWAEDCVEYLENGQIAVLNPFNDELLQQAMTEGRRIRWQDKVSKENLEEVLEFDHLWIPLGIRVNTGQMGMKTELATQEKRQKVGHIRAYIEGGNMISGEDKTGKPLLLIGKDAIYATAYLYQLDEKDVKEIIREDFGMESTDDIISVEQPGQFHLDLGMLFLGNGVVIVNDSAEVLKDAMERAEMVPCLTTEKMAAKLNLQYELEEVAAKDLQEAGLEVIREKLEEEPFYNFFNGEFVQGKDGFNYYITNGGPIEKEEKFQTLMFQKWKVVKKVIFSPQTLAQKSLQERGGVGCRIKGSHS